MHARSKSKRVTRRDVLMGLGLGAGAAGISWMRPGTAALLPAGRRTERHDVVVIGTGMAGTVAALQAKLDDADVVVLEKMPENRNSGNSRLAAGYIAVPSEDAPGARQQYLEDFVQKSQGRGNIALYRLLAENVLGGVAWMKEHGAYPPH